MRRAVPAVFAAVVFCVHAFAADDLLAVKDAAVRLYDQGSYDEALKTLHDLDRAGVLDGPLLYRLFFCERAQGHEEDAQKALGRARLALETETASSTSLENTFYLANTYSNLRRSADARRVAGEMTVKIEHGAVTAPSSAIGLFQLGKLYQDQAKESEASAYYAKAVEAFDLADGRYTGNVRWALRYLGNAAFARADYAGWEHAFSRLTALGGAGASDWDALAIARTRLGKYALAAEAWRAAVALDQTNGDDMRYAARLADSAARLAPLPTSSAAGGAAFPSMDQVDLENYLKGRAEAARAARARATDAKLRAETARTLREVRQQFVAAGLEYAVRHFPIRETAFREGYAVLIFQDGEWEP
jgi:tetratricopeptide (TPR) repeat protein